MNPCRDVHVGGCGGKHVRVQHHRSGTYNQWSEISHFFARQIVRISQPNSVNKGHMKALTCGRKLVSRSHSRYNNLPSRGDPPKSAYSYLELSQRESTRVFTQHSYRLRVFMGVLLFMSCRTVTARSKLIESIAVFTEGDAVYALPSQYNSEEVRNSQFLKPSPPRPVYTGS